MLKLLLSETSPIITVDYEGGALKFEGCGLTVFVKSPEVEAFRPWLKALLRLLQDNTARVASLQDHTGKNCLVYRFHPADTTGTVNADVVFVPAGRQRSLRYHRAFLLTVLTCWEAITEFHAMKELQDALR